MNSRLVLSCVVLTLAGCQPAQDNQTSDSAPTETPVVEVPSLQVNGEKLPLITFVNWNELGVRDTPSAKGKYLTTVYLGEHLELVGDTASDASGGKRNYFHKVMLSDGSSGWVQDDFIAVNAVPAAFVEDTPVCKRPDQATVSDVVFSKMDYVAAVPSTGEWVEVRGRRKNDKWFSTGYVKSAVLTFYEDDLAFAALYRRYAETDKEKIKTALKAQMFDFNPDENAFVVFAFPELRRPGMGERAQLNDAARYEEMIASASICTFESYSQSGQYISAPGENDEVVSMSDGTDESSIEFRIFKDLVPDCDKCVVFESVKRPGYFLSPVRVDERKILQLIQYDLEIEGIGDRADPISFVESNGLGGSIGQSYFSSGFDGYLWNSGEGLRISGNDGTQLFKEQATFNRKCSTGNN